MKITEKPLFTQKHYDVQKKIFESIRLLFVICFSISGNCLTVFKTSSLLSQKQKQLLFVKALFTIYAHAARVKNEFQLVFRSFTKVMTKLTVNNMSFFHKDILKITSGHIYILPHPSLRPFIAHYTLLRTSDNTTPDELQIIPDASGCIVCAFNGVKWEFRLWGPTSQVMTVSKQKNPFSFMFFIEFRPCGAHQFLGIPLSSLHNSILNLDHVDQVLTNNLRTCLEQADWKTFSFLKPLNMLFLNRLKPSTDLDLTQYITHKIINSHGLYRIRQLSCMTSYSERHLNRVFTKNAGMNIKLFSRLARINKACHILKYGTERSLTHIAHELNFYDQAHFTHDFKAVCGSSPAAYFREQSVFYNEELKFSNL